jgi:hypothetical protein
MKKTARLIDWLLGMRKTALSKHSKPGTSDQKQQKVALISQSTPTRQSRYILYPLREAHISDFS